MPDLLEPRTDVRVVLLASFIHSYRVPLFEELGKRVNDLHILVSTILRPRDRRPAEWSRLDVEVQHRLSVQRVRRHPGGFDEPFAIHVPYDTLWRLLRYRPDVVIAHEMGPRTLQAILYKLLDRRCRVIVWATVSERNERGRGRLRELARRWILRHADAVLVNGASGERYIRGFGVPVARLYHVPYTAATGAPEHPPARREGLPQRLLYVGQLAERKGLRPFVDALSTWAREHPDREMEFRLVGRGPLRDEVASLALPQNLAVRLLDAIPNDQLPDVYAAADVFCFPTLSDEWGVVVNEALTAGVPVLGSVYSQAVEELITDGATGWLFRPDDTSDMRRALDAALSTPRQRLCRMGRRGQLSIRMLSPDRIAGRIAQAVADVAPPSAGS